MRTTPKKRRLAATARAIPRPLAQRLGRMEDLLIEMRGVLDLHLKRITSLQQQLDLLAEPGRARPIARGEAAFGDGRGTASSAGSLQKPTSSRSS